MAAPTPSAVFGTFASDTGADTFTFSYAASNLPQITDDNVATDARALMYGLLEKLADWYDANPADRPENLRIVRSGSLVAGTPPYIVKTFNVTLKLEAGDMELLPEPT